jgi:hypothetical protein
MGESIRENNGLLNREKKLQFIEAPGEKSDPPSGRAEVRSMLVRLLVKLYVERHKELVKDAA